jgi:formylglycine-generating enzyme required for sulfatase activity
VSWDDAVAYCKKVSERTGRAVRLPTEAEWEYACRAGSTTAYAFGDDAAQLEKYAWAMKHAWFTKNSGSTTHDVGGKQPNAWRLYDMHGNVWEWCSDWYKEYYPSTKQSDPTGPSSGKHRVLRGGSFNLFADFCRSAIRNGGTPGVRNNWVGFRVCVDSK